MLLYLTRIIIFLSLSVKLAAAEESQTVATTLVENVTVISAHLDQPRHNMDVLIQDGKVLSVTKTGMNPASEHLIDGSGKFLIPGLIDSHVHLGHNPMVFRDNPDEFARLNRSYMRQLPRSFLYHGFTSVIDLDYDPKRNGWLPETPIAPHVYHCGRGVRVAGGYGPVFVPAEFVHKAFPNLIYEAGHKKHWPVRLEPKRYDVDAAVQRVVQSGAICLKTYVEAGFGGTFDWPVPSDDTLSSLATAAHHKGLIFIVHATSADAWQRAVAAGADVIGHGLWHWNGDRREAALTKEAKSAIGNAVQAGTAVQPTLRIVEGERDTLTWRSLDEPGMAAVLAPELLTYLHSENGRWSHEFLLEIYNKHNPHPETSPETLIDVSIKRVRDTMMMFYRSGGELLLGSDTPSQDGIGNPPGLNGYLEMVSWADAGIPLEKIFRAATLGNARAFGLDDRIGTIEPGKQADLLLLNTNPLADVTAYDDISAIIVDGKVRLRGTLSAQLQKP
ncbi:MAG: amidohydrolase family protein [Stappiaceae bacterium]